MQLFILAVGKGRGSAESQLAEDWIGRLPDGGQIVEIESKFPAGVKRTEDEGARLLRALPSASVLSTLDPPGQDHSSDELAALIGHWRDSGYTSAAFAIGGADGHATDIRQKAQRIISFGRATWPHMLCRAMLAEQLYRASMILAGHPYHRGN